MENSNCVPTGRRTFSTTFLTLAVIFVVCLITSNLIASKVFSLGGISLPAAVIVFPISYIINDCLSEVYGYKKAMIVIYLGFILNIFVILITQLAILLPASENYASQEAFETIFKALPRATIASLIAFFVGSTLNAFVMSKMKVLQNGKNFWLRAIVSSIVGECADSLIFIPVMFWAFGIQAVAMMILFQVTTKVIYEIIILPITRMVVEKIKKHENIDTFDNHISFNPFKLR